MDTSIAEEKFTAYIGLDWANAKHDVCVQASNSDIRESGKFQHTAAHIDQWAHEIHTRFGGTIAVALELTKGPIVYACKSTIFLCYFLSIHPCWPNIAKRFSPVAQSVIVPTPPLRWISLCAIATS